MTPKQIHERLAQDAESVCRAVLPGGKRIGHDYCAGSIAGGEGKSLKVCLTGTKAGLWADFATGTESGDLIDLIKCARGCTVAEAIRWAKEFAHIRDDAPQFTPRAAKAKPLAPISNRTVSEPVVQFMTARGITLDTLQAYRCTGVGSVLTMPCYVGDDLMFAKYADVAKPKKERFSCAPGATQVLFGWQAIDDDAREVVITEGEMDAMAYYQYGAFPALSIPMGAGTGAKQQWIENDWDRLERFDTIYLSMDMDEAGKPTAEHLARRLGLHRCRIVSLPVKDANDALQGGVDLVACLRASRYLDPEELKTPNDFSDAVYDAFYPSDDRKLGALLPWDRTLDKFRLRPGEVTVWTGINGHGKSLVLSHIVASLMHGDNRVCVASMEMPAAAQLKRLFQQASGRALPEPPHIIRLLDWATGRVWIINIRGTAKADKLLEVSRYAWKRYGVSNLVIDSLAKCGMAEDDYNGQKAFVETLTDFAMETGLHVHLVAHARKGEDENAAPGKMDIKGTGAITDMVDNVVSVWRNKKKEEAAQKAAYLNMPVPADVREKPDAVLHVQKQRNFDWEGKVGLFFDRESHQYYTSTMPHPVEYVP